MPILELLGPVLKAVDIFERSEDGQKRANLKTMRRERKKLYKFLKKDGEISAQDQELLNKADNAIVNAMIKLGEF